MKAKTFQGALLLLLLAPIIAAAQADGAFNVEKSVIAAGGGKSTGGAFTLEGTSGQPAAGNVQGGAFSIAGGFVTPILAPTAAMVSVGGRVRTASGKGIRNVRVTLVDSSGETRYALTGLNGAYRFDNVSVGKTYVISVSAKRFVFINPTQVLNLVEPLSNLDFIGAEQW